MDLIKDYLDITVFTVLGLMSLMSLAYSIERMVHFSRLDVRQFRHPESLRIDLNRGLMAIASIASNAPYIGLLGTVFGIMLTFYDIGQSGQIDTNAVMVGLSLALKATALGLLVAIPSMMFYNALAAKAETIMSQWKVAHDLQREKQRADSAALRAQHS